MKNDTLRWWNITGQGIEGRRDAETGSLRYYLKDHLGCTRAVVDNNGTVLESFDYYPFGLLMPKRNTTGAGTMEKFTGKERDEAIGLDYFGARYYDPVLGRWHNVDPLVNKYPEWSSYNYTLNNPLRYTDPDGRDIWEKIANVFNGKGWRDDTIEENFAEKDWKNATPQVAKRAGITNNKITVVYQPNDPESRFVTRGVEISTTPGGFEVLSEGNIDNSTNNMVHERRHAEDNLNEVEIKARDKLEKRAKEELKAIEEQRADPSWEKTTKSHKQNIANYEQFWRQTLRATDRRYDNNEK